MYLYAWISPYFIATPPLMSNGSLYLCVMASALYLDGYNFVTVAQFVTL